jgi:hypothetical protein
MSKKFYQVVDFEGTATYYPNLASGKRAFAILKKEMINMKFSGTLELDSFQFPPISLHELHMRLLNHHEFVYDRKNICSYTRN